MTTIKWKNRIKKACKDAGTYKPFFDDVINTLAEILNKRDAAQEQFELSGANPLIAHTNKAGATNIEQNPAVRLINDLNRDALAYWKELGLTPAGLRKINETAIQPEKKPTALEKALLKLGG